MTPVMEFATASDGVRIAWSAVGSGPVFVHMPGVPLSNLEAEWRIPVLQRAYGRLGERVRLIQYDGRGTGRSQREVDDVSLDADLRDLDAVLAAAGAAARSCSSASTTRRCRRSRGPRDIPTGSAASPSSAAPCAAGT